MAEIKLQSGSVPHIPDETAEVCCMTAKVREVKVGVKSTVTLELTQDPNNMGLAQKLLKMTEEDQVWVTFRLVASDTKEINDHAA